MVSARLLTTSLISSSVMPWPVVTRRSRISPPVRSALVRFMRVSSPLMVSWSSVIPIARSKLATLVSQSLIVSPETQPGSRPKATSLRTTRRPEGNPTITRYRDQVALADPQSIWELGCDTNRWSHAHHPGEVLKSSAPNVQFLHNPENMPADSLVWLSNQTFRQHELEVASHWTAVDHPDLMARHLLAALEG